MFSPVKRICIYDREKALSDIIDQQVKAEASWLLRKIKDDMKREVMEKAKKKPLAF